VEGKKDKMALERIGFKNIITISGKPNGTLVQILKNKKVRTVAILTDFDEEGQKKIYRAYKTF
jgi:5S rRNA maturation endonuclease (ribonuclease M5)